MTRNLTQDMLLEQYSLRGDGPSTDYVLCASMYELITGQLPPKQQTDFNQKC